MLLREVHGDLFVAKDNMAHCVSADFHMSAGIAVEFKNRYGHKAELLSECWEVGSVARKKLDSGLYVFYMVTKARYFQKPTYSNLRRTIIELARWVELLGIRSLAIPPISCVRDKLEWSRVRAILEEVFNGLDVEIVVYFL